MSDMKKSLLLIPAICLFAANVQAADVKPYVSAKAKYANIWAQEEQKKPFHTKNHLSDNVFGYNLAAGAGVKMENGILRFELDYTSNEDGEKMIAADKIEIKSRAIFGNAYFDIDTNSAFRPYLGFGLGGSKVKIGDKSVSKFAYQYSAGVSYLFNDNTAVDLGYRATSYADFEEERKGVFPRKVDYKVYGNELTLGVRFSF